MVETSSGATMEKKTEEGLTDFLFQEWRPFFCSRRGLKTRVQTSRRRFIICGLQKNKQLTRWLRLHAICAAQTKMIKKMPPTFLRKYFINPSFPRKILEKGFLRVIEYDIQLSIMGFQALLIPYFLFSLMLFPNFFIQSSGLRKMRRKSVIRLPNGDSYGHPFDPTRVTQISWHPRAFLYRNFLTDAECDHLIRLAKDKLELSMVADNESGKSVASEVRTSLGMFLWKNQDKVIAGIESRISAWTFLPVENGEAMQVLHYENGQKYEPHWDYFHDKANQVRGGHRVVTILMYLSNVRKGGETVFPNSEIKDSQPKAIKDWSECAKKGYAVKPEKGDALLFFSLHPNTTLDEFSLHESCPVIEGEKWSATKWIHVRNFDKPQ